MTKKMHELTLAEHKLIGSLMQLRLVEHCYELLLSQLSIYTGKERPGLADLQDWYNKNHINLAGTFCAACGQRIESPGHKAECEIVIKYLGKFPN